MDLLIGKKSRRNVGIIREYHNFLEGLKSNDMFTISAKYDNTDTWFLLLISAIWAELRLVGDIPTF